jgi:hypothetical protein
MVMVMREAVRGCVLAPLSYFSVAYVRLQIDRLDVAIGADQVAAAFRKADACEPFAGQADLGHIAARTLSRKIGIACAELA